MATGVNACDDRNLSESTSSHLRCDWTDLEHLDKGNAQAEIRKVGQDQTTGEESADGKNGSHPLITLLRRSEISLGSEWCQ